MLRQKKIAATVLSGDRGIGKTALAKLIKYISSLNDSHHHNLKFLTSYYSVQEGQTFEYVLQTSLNILTDQLPNAALKRLTERLGSIFKNGKFNIGAFSVEVGAPDVKEVHLKDQAVSIFTNILKGLEDSSEKQDGILIIIDEIHNLVDLKGTALLLRNIATTLDVDNLGKVSFLILGYPEAIKKFFDGDPSAKRHFDQIQLDCMPINEAKEVLTKGFKEVGLGFTEELLDEYIRYTGGYPHSIQLLGHNLVEVDNDNNLTEDDWKSALGRTAIELKNKDFSNMYNFDGKETLREQLLNILAIAGRPLEKTDLKNDFDEKNVYRSLQELRKLGAIKEDGTSGRVMLNSQLFRTAILIHIVPQIPTTPYLRSAFDKYVKKAFEAPAQEALKFDK